MLPLVILCSPIRLIVHVPAARRDDHLMTTPFLNRGLSHSRLMFRDKVTFGTNFVPLVID